ncbi:hypothetical protein AVEN_93955-1 [Araneus ventricosus]|uniref:Uncharacterized protein n=1 Tax=Araneus ventricosus TaxID=182803 RepID=A0A4Y2CJH1_ARAVE|nr:hypothetical protein AVEN_93955-1 [Araneus ventricosus]
MAHTENEIFQPPSMVCHGKRPCPATGQLTSSALRDCRKRYAWPLQEVIAWVRSGVMEICISIKCAMFNSILYSGKFRIWLPFAPPFPLTHYGVAGPFSVCAVSCHFESLW